MGAYNKYEEPKKGQYFYRARGFFGNYKMFDMTVEVLGECQNTYYIKTITQGEAGILPYIGTTLYVQKRDVKINNTKLFSSS